MRQALSVALVMVAIGSARPAAQQITAPAAGPIARSLEREAARFANFEQGTSDDPEWSRVRRLAPGTDISVTVRGSDPVERCLVAQDDSGLILLNLTGPALTSDVKELLRGVAARHPEYFPAVQRGAAFVLENRVRISADGVFVTDRKVADFQQLVERADRLEVAEIKMARVKSNVFGCALTGYFLGSFIGGFAGGYIGGAISRDKDAGFMRGMVVGMPVGATLLYRECRDKEWYLPAEVIYLAP